MKIDRRNWLHRSDGADDATVLDDAGNAVFREDIRFCKLPR